MAYLGTTAATSSINPPRALQPIDPGRIGSSAGPLSARLWLWSSTDVSTSAFVAGYFSDGYQLGMKEGDIVMYVNRTSTVTSSLVLGLGVVSSVSSTGGGTQLSTWSFLTST